VPTTAETSQASVHAHGAASASESEVEPAWVASLREHGRAGLLYARLHGVMAALGIIFLVVFVSERVAPPGSPLTAVFRATGLVIWAVFILEFLARLALAPKKRAFLRANWWHPLLLLLPFLNAVRAGSALRLSRLGRAVSASLRGTRSARSRFAGRLGTLVTVTVAVVLVATDVVFEFGGVRPYAKALHDVALATVTGEPLRAPSVFAQTMEVLLATYSAVFFAALAAALGAYFLEHKHETG